MEQTLLLAPLAGALVSGIGWRLIGESAARWIATVLIIIATLVAWLMVLGAADGASVRYLHTWIEAGSFSAALAFRFDHFILVVLVLTMSALVHLLALSRPATHEEKSNADKSTPGQEARLCAGLGLSTASMVLLIAADDLAQMLAGWIGTGFATYLLTGVITRKPAAGKAALRVALTLRVGEAALLLAVGLMFALTDTIRFDDLFQALPDLGQVDFLVFRMTVPTLEIIAGLIVLASLVMAAQAVFFGWFSDLAEAPPPAVALIVSAGPVVAASVLLMRMEPVLDLAPLATGALVAAAMATVVIGATSAIAQQDPMRVIACLAGAQAGFILASLGVGASTAATLHLFASSSALAMLALTIGVAIGRSDAAQQLDRLGGYGRALPLLLAAGALAAASLSGFGVPGSALGLSGFISYGAVFDALNSNGAPELLWAGGLAVGFCSLAAWRLVLRVFVYAPRDPAPVPERTPAMRVVSVPLVFFGAISAIFVMFLGTSASDISGLFVVLAGLAGLILAVLGARNGASLTKSLKTAMPWAHNALLNGWYITPLLRMLVAAPLMTLTTALARRQRQENGEAPQAGVLKLAPVLAQQAGRLQGGLLAGYGVALVIGVVILVMWMVLMGGAS